MVRFRESDRLVSVLLSGDGVLEAGNVELEGSQPILQPRPSVLKLPNLQSQINNNYDIYSEHFYIFTPTYLAVEAN